MIALIDPGRYVSVRMCLRNHAPHGIDPFYVYIASSVADIGSFISCLTLNVQGLQGKLTVCLRGYAAEWISYVQPRQCRKADISKGFCDHITVCGYDATCRLYI